MRQEIHGVSNVWCTAYRQQTVIDLMQLLGFYDEVDMLDMASSLHWYEHVMRTEDHLVLRRALEFEVEAQRRKGNRIGRWRINVRWLA